MRIISIVTTVQEEIRGYVTVSVDLFSDVEEYHVQEAVNIDHFISLFDRLWEMIGRRLKGAITNADIK